MFPVAFRSRLGRRCDPAPSPRAGSSRSFHTPFPFAVSVFREPFVMSSSPLGQLLDRVEHDISLDSPEQLRERIDVLNRLDELDGWPPSRRTELTRQRLERANSAVYQAIRDAVMRGEGRAAFAPWLTAPAHNGIGYDYLDDVVAGVLQFEEIGTATVEPTPEMVFYQPTPARHIFELFDRTALEPDDVLVDLGAGLGHVPILAAIATPARAIGVEVEPAYVACAQRTADSLRLHRASFIEGDARDFDLSEGTVFYLYTPFSGQMLRSMLDRLALLARSRSIRVCSFGPCSTTLAEESWLETTDSIDSGRLVVFQSRSSP